MILKDRHGFTIVELLVVISIIGLLASVVLASLNTARTRGKDAAIKAQMQQMRQQAEIFFASHGSYTGTGVAAVDDSLGECLGSAGKFVGTLYDPALPDGIASMMQAVYQHSSGAGSRVTCIAHPNGWAFAAPLYYPSGSNTGWCVDGAGSAKEVAHNFNAVGNPFVVSGGIVYCQ